MAQRLIVGIAGGSASGKSSLARRVGELLHPNAEIISLDDYFLHDRSRGPFTPPDAEDKRHFDLNHPDAIDWPAVWRTIEVSAAQYLLIEGNFALASAELRQRLSLRVFVQVPDDIRLGRKITRNFLERGTSPAESFQNYLNSGKPGHDSHVAPTVCHADLILNGEKAVAENAERLVKVVVERSKGREV